MFCATHDAGTNPEALEWPHDPMVSFVVTIDKDAELHTALNFAACPEALFFIRCNES